jgi:diaminopimelate epimerase
VEQCGNGARCFVRFVHDRELTQKRAIVVETQSGLISPRLEDDGRVTVNMGAPIFEAALIPFHGGGGAVSEPLEVAGETLEISALSMGNPHAVQVVADVERAPVGRLGPLIERHPRFPGRVNAVFMQVMDRSHIRLRVYERGSGETLSCGSGACAAVVAGIRRGLLDSPVSVATRGGLLGIVWDGGDAPVLMTGPAIAVFEGEINL